MRIFISTPDSTGSNKTTRLSIINCTDTTELIRLICRQLKVNKNAFIFLLKNQIVNLRILEDWPISIYGIKNGSWILMRENLLFSKKELSNSSTASLEKIEQNSEDMSEEISNLSIQSPPKTSFFTNKDSEYHEYFQKQLSKMLSYVRQNRLDCIASLLKQQPDIQDQKLRDQVLSRKNHYVLNQIGQCGRNALHWAIHNQNAQIFTFLLLKFTDPTTLTIDQYTPLQLAVVHRNIQIAKILLNQPQVDPNKVTTHGTALHLAVYHNCVPLIKQLLDHGVSIDQLDKDGKKPCQLTDSKQIKMIFEDHQKKLKLRFLKPNITKGVVLKISSLTFRGKPRTMMVNPFKGDLTIFKENNIVDHKLKISGIRQVCKITQKTWLMDSKLNYFRIVYDNEDDQGKMIFAVKHAQILSRWIQSLELAITYTTNQKYVTKIQSEMQLVQMLDDVKNQIKVHKRQIDNKKVQSPTKKKYSIIDMKVSNQIEQSTAQKKKQVLHDYAEVHFQDTSVVKSFGSMEGNQLRQSQILLGSILMEKNFQQHVFQSPTSRNTIASTYFNKSTEIQTPQFLTVPSKASSFRKKSQDFLKISQFVIQPKQKVSFSDFQFIKQLGSGAFGQVYLTKRNKTQKVFAMKVLNKKKLMAKKQLKYAVSQTNILKRIEHPFIICLYYSFQTPSNLYLALDYCPYGDLSQILCEKQRFTEMTARFIIAQAILAIEYLHKQKIIYRDLKPENVLLSKDGYIKLIDFGLSKQNNFAMSFCGSPAYLSPEMLQKKGHSFPTDIYGLGCILYEMVIGQPPYYDQNLEQMFENIKSARLKFPGYVTKQIKSLITRMLDRDPSKRIGSSNMKELKSHQFFNGFNWQKLLKKQLTVPKQIFPQSIENDYFKLQNKIHQETLNYVDQEYTQASMVNRIKGFSFSRVVLQKQ